MIQEKNRRENKTIPQPRMILTFLFLKSFPVSFHDYANTSILSKYSELVQSQYNAEYISFSV